MLKADVWLPDGCSTNKHTQASAESAAVLMLLVMHSKNVRGHAIVTCASKRFVNTEQAA